VVYEVARLYISCAQRCCENLFFIFFRLDKKEVLRLFTRVFTPSRLDETLILLSQVPKERLMEIECDEGEVLSQMM
jgi:hypothetical protein